MNIQEMNEKLLEAQTAWYEQVAIPYCQKHNPENFSAPFCCGIAKYDDTKPTVMIVGQEARISKSTKKSLGEMQAWGINYQLEQFAHGTNSSPFWRLLKKFDECNIVWNNLDKIHRYKENGNCGTLILDDESILSSPFVYENERKSLLLHEVNMIKPNIILFITGPNYHASMATALGIEDKKAFKRTKPTKKSHIHLIDIPDLNPPALWTYHPAYLNRIDKLDSIKNDIEKLIKL